MRKAIVFGSLNMDLTIECEAMPQAGQTIDGRCFFINPGGKGGNQAVAASKLGAPTYMIARVGKDLFGRQLREALESYGVDCANVSESGEGSTGVAVITRCRGDNRIILSAGANHEMSGGDVKQILETLGEPGDVFMTQYECGALAVAQALTAAKKMGLFTLFNPAPAKAIPPELYPDIDLIIVNQTECQFLTGIYPADKDSAGNALDAFLALGAGGAVITLGGGGSICRWGGETYSGESHDVPVVDTTAAGDSYIGALASAIVRGERMEECVYFAAKAAALTVTRQGAQQSIPCRQEIEAYFEEEEA